MQRIASNLILTEQSVECHSAKGFSPLRYGSTILSLIDALVFSPRLVSNFSNVTIDALVRGLWCLRLFDASRRAETAFLLPTPVRRQQGRGQFPQVMDVAEGMTARISRIRCPPVMHSGSRKVRQNACRVHADLGRSKVMGEHLGSISTSPTSIRGLASR